MTSPLTHAVLAAALCSPVAAFAQDAIGVGTPAGETDTAAPTETDAKTRAFLDMAAEAIYMPERHGLESLSFDFTLPGPAGPLATLSCSWTKDGGTTVAKELNLEGIPEEQRPMVEMQTAGLEQAGHEYMALQLNTVIRNNLESMVANLRGVEDGLIAVDWAPKTDSGLPPVKQTYYFDDEGMWVRTDGIIPMQGQELPNKENLTWIAVDGTDEYVQSEMSSELTMPFGGAITQKTTFERADIHGINLVTALKISINMGPMGQQDQDMLFENIVVNGKAADAEG